MTIFEKVKAALDDEGIKYFVSPKEEELQLRWHFENQSVNINLFIHNNHFVSIRARNLLEIASDHRKYNAIRDLINSTNYNECVTKAGWDPEDGEVSIQTAAWFIDCTPNSETFHTMFRQLLAVTNSFVLDVERILCEENPQQRIAC